MSVQDTPTRDSLRLESDKLVYDWGWIDCEERIIKLLENKMFEDKRLWSKDFAKGAKWAIKETVELIKGEK